MSRRPRRNHTVVFKAKVALAAIRGDKTLAELAEQYEVDSNQIAQRKAQLLARATDVFVERLCKSVKYEDVYLKAYGSVSHARESIEKYLAFYNTRRPHSSLDGVTPDQFYFNSLPQAQAA